MLRDWIGRGVDPGHIVILSRQSYASSLISSIEPKSLPRRIVDVTKEDAPGEGFIRFSTIAGFKGLEADAVLVVDIKELSDPEEMARMYIGASRARMLLGLVLPEACRPVYVDRVAELIGRLVEQPSRASAKAGAQTD